MSYDSQTDAIYGRLCDLNSAIQGIQAQADQLKADALAIHMVNVPSDIGQVSAVLAPVLSKLQDDAKVLSDCKVSL